MILALGSASAQGRECRGVGFEDQVGVDGGALALNGLGLRLATIFKVKVYVAALYLAKTSTDPNAILEANTPSELILHFVRDVDAKDIRGAWSEGFEKNAGDQLPALQPRIGILNGWMADVKSGQRLIFIHKPGTGIEVNVNGAPKGIIKGDDFARAFLSIWLGAKPPNPEVKSGLLGGSCG
jgi:hypothetical protein